VLSITDDSRKVIVRPDTQQILGVFKSGYQVHGYDEWLIKHVESILDADLHIGSAGLLRGGAVAWVQTELADTLEVQGVEFRPFLTAATSLDGSLATTYQTGAQLVVCDNTLQAALGDSDSERLKIRHSRHSLGRISDVRDALKIIHTAADEFAHEVELLTAQSVSDKTWAKFVDAFSAPTVKKGAEPTKRQLTSQTKIGDTLKTLYANDNRVAPWAGTAYGVVAAVNTYQHHEVHTAGRSKAERNAEFTVTGRWAKNTADTLELLAAVN
jgi:phage/plasmid-like protein (TIGR03299 family)